MTAAVLVIDVQQGLSTGAWAMHDAAIVIERIDGVLSRARAAGAPVVFVQHEEADGLVLDSDAWQLDPRLDVQAGDLRIRKTACDAFHRTELQAALDGRGVDRLVVCGFQTDFCVDTTVRRALALGYPVTLVADAHSTIDNGVLDAARIVAHHNETLGALGSFGPRATPVAAREVAFGG